MSLWEIEALIEDGINIVDKADATNEEKVQLIGNLYAIQESFDCKFTNFRVMPVLLKTGYTITIDYTEHPDYEGNKAYFEKLLKKDDIEFIYRDIKKKWSGKNDVAAYLEKATRKIYIDYGSPLRKGEPTLETMNVYALGAYLIREAHKQQDKGGVYHWTAYLIKFGAIDLEDDVTAEELIEKYFGEIKEIWYGYDYSDFKPLHQSLTIYRPGAEGSDRFTEWAISEGNVQGELVQWFFNINNSL